MPSCKFLTILVLPVSLFLGGMASCEGGRPAQQLATYCEDYRDAYRAFVNQAKLGQFSLETLEAVEAASPVPERVCSGDLTGPDGQELTFAAAIAEVERAYFQILVARQEG